MGKTTDRFIRAARTLFERETAPDTRELKQDNKRTGKRKTIPAVKSGEGPKYFRKLWNNSKRERDRKQLEKYKLVYDQGGLTSQAFDCYPTFVSTNGYRIEGEDENTIKEAQEFLDEIDYDMLSDRIIIDALVMEHGFQEIVVEGDEIINVVPIDSETMEIERDDRGNITAFFQYADASQREENADLNPEDVIHFEYRWLMQRAYDDIMRDVKTAEGIAKAMERHGFPKWHIKVGEPGEGGLGDAIKKVGKEFEELKPDTEITTVHDVEILPLDEVGLSHVQEYNDVGIMRVAASMGVPEELMGLGRGSTEATANVKLQAFYDSIGALQKRVARAYNKKALDRKFGKGAVKIVYNDVNPADAKTEAEIVATLTSNQIDPFILISKAEARDRLGYKDDPEEDEFDEGTETEPPDEE